LIGILNSDILFLLLAEITGELVVPVVQPRILQCTSSILIFLAREKSVALEDLLVNMTEGIQCFKDVGYTPACAEA
jgi:hypothetical protein